MTDALADADERWSSLIGPVLAGPGDDGTSAPETDPGAGTGRRPGAVAAIGARAARLLDAVASDADTASSLVVALADGPRFATLADCALAPPSARAADAALLSLDALADTVADASRALDRALGTACRLYPARLLLFVEQERAPLPERLFAFGFRRLLAGPEATLHEYRLRDYKMPPEWLNARFWANPERFSLDVDAEGRPAEDEHEEEDDDEEE